MKILKITGFAIPLTLIACGDSGTTENITNNYTSGMEIADKVSNLPKCTADNAGEQYLVKADGEFYACNGKEWKVLGGSGSAADYSCETKPLADDRGVAIYCGGDSIGVVLNGAKGDKGDAGEQGIQGVQGERGEQGVAGTPGKDGAQGLQGEKGETGSDGEPGAGCKVVSQTESAVTIQCGDDKFNMNLNGGSGEVIEPVEEVVSLEKLNGVSQKGPFINGSTVTLFELDGSRSLVQTGRTFGGEIITDDGRFSVNNVSLKSSYVRMTANGFYRNEVTGKNSTSSIVLNAYSDLQARSSVNINLLTHLEYYRVGYLMENGLESTIKASKKRAQKEIFAAFGIDNNGFDYSEDLDVFGEGDQNAALLAMSILLQGDRSEADLSALLASFGKDIEKDGKWDENAVTRAKIADWADSVDLGLKGSLTLSKIESNVSGWGLGTVPAFQKYVRNFWYKEYGLGDCDESNANVVVRDTNSRSAYYASTYAYAGSNDKKVRFICDEKSKLWRRATDLEKDTAGWGHDFKTGDVRNGRVNTNLVYVYEDNNWRHGTTLDSTIKTGGYACTKERLGDYFKDTRGNYHVCTAQQNTPDTLRKWVAAGTLDNDTYEARPECSATGKYGDGTILDGRVNSGNKYVCDKNGFKTATANDLKAGKGCTEYTEGEYAVLSGQYSYYKCESGSWNFTLEKLNYGELTYAGQTYKTIGIKTQMWMAENLNYDPGDVSAMGSYAWHGCYDNAKENCTTYGRLYTWEVAAFYGICPEGWHLPKSSEFHTMLSVTGKKIRANSWLSNDDVFGFSLLPAGYRDYNDYRGYFIHQGGLAYLWSSSGVGSGSAYSLDVNGSGASVYYYDKYLAFSVRCLKNSD